jgi:hypothetical protein
VKHVCLMLIFLALPAFSEQPKCKGNQKVVAACFVVHGRANIWMGTPALRIWPVKSHRLLGVTDGPFADDTTDPIYPEKMKKIITGYDELIYGDFEVCPFTADKPGEMRMVCIESASHLVVRKRDSEQHLWH